MSNECRGRWGRPPSPNIYIWRVLMAAVVPSPARAMRQSIRGSVRLDAVDQNWERGIAHRRFSIKMVQGPSLYRSMGWNPNR